MNAIFKAKYRFGESVRISKLEPGDRFTFPNKREVWEVIENKDEFKIVSVFRPGVFNSQRVMTHNTTVKFLRSAEAVQTDKK